MSYSSVVLSDTPIIYLKLDEASGYTCTDSSGNGYNYTYADVATAYHTVGPLIAESPNYAVQFTSTSIDRAYRTTQTYKLPAGNWSLECWFKNSTDYTTQRLIFGSATYLDTPNYANLAIGAYGTQIYGVFLNSSTTEYTISSGTGYNDGLWKHIVLTYDSGLGSDNLKLYINKVLVASTNATGVAKNTGTGISAGGLNSASSSKYLDVDAEMAHCAFYHSALSASAVEAHYDAAVPEIIQPTTGSIIFTGYVPFVKGTAFVDHSSSWYRDLSVQHLSSWRRLTELSVQHQSSWGLLQPSIEHQSSWGLVASIAHQASWRKTEILSTAHEAAWEALSVISSTHTAGWNMASVLALSVAHTASWDRTSTLFASHRSGWDFNPTITIEHDSSWRSISYLSIEHLSSWYELSLAVEHKSSWRQYLEGTVSTEIDLIATVNGNRIFISSATVSCDEGSSYWSCEMELVNASDKSLFQRNTPFTVSWFGTTFSFIVDNSPLTRSIDQEGNVSNTVSINGLSPLCTYESPRATVITKTWDTPLLSSVIVTELLGSVTWNLVDWVIPANRLSVDNASPLSIAKQIVEAAGGLIESNPDGSIVVRHKWPVAANLLSTASATLLGDNNLFSVAESSANDNEINKLRILDADSTDRDSMEFIRDENDWKKGVIRAYPSPWRGNLSITKTRNSPPIYLTGESQTTESLTEIIEFTNGGGSTSKPISQLTTVVWMDVDLGGLSFQPYSTELTSSIRGWSLAEVTYVARYMYTNARTEEATSAQFLLEEEI